MQMIYVSVKNFFIEIKSYSEWLLEKFIRLIIYMGVLLIPLFFIPLSDSFYEFSKIILFYFLVIFIVLLWIVKIYINKKINWQIKFLDVSILLFLIIYLLASIFSIDIFYSFFGSYLILDGAFLTICFLVLFYFIISRFITKISQLRVIFYLIILVVSLLCLINFLGLFFSLTFLANLTINSFNLFLVIGVISSIILFLTSSKLPAKVLNIFVLVLFLLFLFIIDSVNILMMLAILVFLLIFFLSFKSDLFSNKIIIFLTAIIFLTVIVLVVPMSTLTSILSPVELALPIEFGWQITQDSLTENFLLGVGPQNFSYSFFKYKPLSYNDTNLWQFGFSQNSNFFLELLNNIGILGILILVIIILNILWRVLIYFKNLKILNQGQYNQFLFVVGLTVSLLGIIIWSFFVNFDFVLFFISVLFLGLLVGFLHPKKGVSVFNNKALINFSSAIIVIIILCCIYFAGKIIYSDIIIEQVFARNYSTAQEFELGEKRIERAIALNSFRTDNKLQLVNFLINKRKVLIENDQEFDESELQEKIILNTKEVLDNETKKIEKYLILRQISNELESFGIVSYDLQGKVLNKLISLDPNNPELYIDRALMNFDQYLFIADDKIEIEDKQNIVVTLIKNIENDLNKSIEIKNDFVLGYYNLGLYWQAFGDEEQALKNIAKAFSLDPGQIVLALDLKKLYLNQDKVEQAIEVLNKYLELVPTDTSLRLELVNIYLNNQSPEKALLEINKVIEIDSENEQALNLLEEMK